MAKNATRATETTKAKDDSAVKGEIIKAGGKDTVVDTKIAEALERFGKATYLKACDAANVAISEVRQGDDEIKKIEGEILLKREGNAHKLFNLAKLCVDLTMKGKRAMLEDAAELMRAACQFAEETTVSEFAKTHNGVQYTIAQIVPSWPPMRANTINAMAKAKLNPHKFPAGPSKLTNAYKEWKANPENASEKASTGPKARVTDTSGKAPVQVSKAVAKTAEQMGKLTDSVRSSLAEMVRVLQTKPEAVQNHAAELISQWTKQIAALKAADLEVSEDEAAGVQTKRPPNPARVPESNQVAQ